MAKFALLLVMVAALTAAGCANMGPNTQQGATMGAVLGGVTGAVVGHQTGRALEGAAIGAGVGAVTGGAIGSAHDKAEQNRPAYPSGSPAYAAPPVEQEAATPPPGRWVTVPGQWVGGQWVPAHKVWMPVNP
jgi:hypothetical protein